MPLSPQDTSYLHLLRLGAFVRRPRGGWRFGTKVISETVVERLLANGHATLEQDRVFLTVRGEKNGNGPC